MMAGISLHLVNLYFLSSMFFRHTKRSKLVLADETPEIKIIEKPITRFEIVSTIFWPVWWINFWHYFKHNAVSDALKNWKKQTLKNHLFVTVSSVVVFIIVLMNINKWWNGQPEFYIPKGGISDIIDALVLFSLAVYVVSNTILNLSLKTAFDLPDYKSMLKRDDSIPANRAPLPDRNRFVLGYDGSIPVYATLNTKNYGNTCRYIIYGQDDRWGKEELIYTFIRGAFANDCLCLILDCAHGADFSPLRYEKFAKLYAEDFKALYGKEKWDSVLQMDAMPNVIVRSSTEDKRDINDALFWLDRELKRRQAEKAAIPDAAWPFLLVVLDAGLTEFFFGGGVPYENLSALDMLAYGKSLNTGIIALADSRRQWTETGAYLNCFESVEFHHPITAKGKGDEHKQFVVRNIVQPAAFTIKYWERGKGREIKAVQVLLPELGAWILEKSASFGKKTDDLYIACLNNKTYIETKESESVQALNERIISVAGENIRQVMKGGKWIVPKEDVKKLKEAA